MGIFVVILWLSFLIFAAFMAFLIWQIRSGQMDDLITPAERALWEDLPAKPQERVPKATDSSSDQGILS